MTKEQFEQYVSQHGKDILRFCRMTTGSINEGDDLYQDTMLTLFEKKDKLDLEKNIKSYALSVSILLWKNRRKKFAWRRRIATFESYEERLENGDAVELANDVAHNPENQILRNEEMQMVRALVRELPEKYGTILHLYYSANLKIEISDCLRIPESTVKSRMHKAKNLLKKKLEVAGYDK